MNVRDWVTEYNENALLADGFDAALVGVCRSFLHPPVAVYDLQHCLRILEEDMTEEEANEYFEYNILGAWFGEGTPIYIEFKPDDLSTLDSSSTVC